MARILARRHPQDPLDGPHTWFAPWATSPRVFDLDSNFGRGSRKLPSPMPRPRGRGTSRKSVIRRAVDPHCAARAPAIPKRAGAQAPSASPGPGVPEDVSLRVLRREGPGSPPGRRRDHPVVPRCFSRGCGNPALFLVEFLLRGAASCRPSKPLRHESQRADARKDCSSLNSQGLRAISVDPRCFLRREPASSGHRKSLRPESQGFAARPTSGGGLNLI
jgi:hypothetical protein